jgi:uncharacterized repeat protein (TIGR01451 family)
VVHSDSITKGPSFGFVSTQPCAMPKVSVHAPFLRRCFANQYVNVNVYNDYLATGILNNAYIELKLDSLLSPTSASLPYTQIGNNTWRINLGTLNPGQLINFTVACSLSCDAIMNQTLCVEANLFPVNSCMLDTSEKAFPAGVAHCVGPWDKSSLEVHDKCHNDTIIFIVKNKANVGGNMQCHSPVRVYVDGVMMQLDSVMLAAGDSSVFRFAGNGKTWRLEADQHPLYPGNSHPNATIEACGDTSNWTPDLVNIFSMDDSDPVTDIYCGLVKSSYDPNDKTGFPLGMGNTHDILPNEYIEYLIRFQNTGNDTAFKVVIRDTLDMNLNMFSVISGASSHNYSFRIYGPRVLEWTFNNIMLPDSSSNQAGSNGFVTFKVQQNKDLVNGTVINNTADIYFDFNSPIITNTTVHTINDKLNMLNVTVKKEEISSHHLSDAEVYPNPFGNSIRIQIYGTAREANCEFTLHDILGGEILRSEINSSNADVKTDKLLNGIYIYTIRQGSEIIGRGKLVKQ